MREPILGLERAGWVARSSELSRYTPTGNAWFGGGTRSVDGVGGRAGCAARGSELSPYTPAGSVWFGGGTRSVREPILDGLEGGLDGWHEPDGCQARGSEIGGAGCWRYAAAWLDGWHALGGSKLGASKLCWMGGACLRASEPGCVARSLEPCVELGHFDPPAAARGTTAATSRTFSNGYRTKFEPLLKHTLWCPGAASHQD